MFEEKGEPKQGVKPASFRLPAEPLKIPPGQAGSLMHVYIKKVFCVVSVDFLKERTAFDPILGNNNFVTLT